MKYPYQFGGFPSKEELLKAYGGKSVQDLPTPSILIDETVFTRNCSRMLENAKELNVDFRPHVKTHKTLEGTLLQLGEASNHKTNKIVVSTLAEAWGLKPLIEEGKIKDVLFSLPVVQSRLEELAELSENVENLRLMLDNVEQLDILKNFRVKRGEMKKWSIFIKINMGTDRAGLINDTIELQKTLEYALSGEIKKHVQIYGFYCHAGHSYKSKSIEEAKSFLVEEITHANKAAKMAISIDPSLRLQLSVGATPTAHSSANFKNLLDGIDIVGQVELHAGNYPCCDLQQVSTNCIGQEDVSLKLLAEVVSSYPKRGSTLPGEQLINAGVIALAREPGPMKGFGKVISPELYQDWIVGRLSQEHGILEPTREGVNFIPLGTKIEIVPQHSCITAASHTWYFIIDKNNKVKDIWIPLQGW